jgi:CheY-like chemotaxis protein
MPRQADLILLAEDDENDIALFHLGLARAKITNPLQIVRNGEECIAYLEGIGMYADRERYPLPSLLLLDLKMPLTDGFAVLSWIRSHATLSRLRIVVLTSSHNIADVNLAYDLGANSFLTKTLDVRDFADQLRGVSNHWLSLSTAPEVERSPSGSPQLPTAQNVSPPQPPGP